MSSTTRRMHVLPSGPSEPFRAVEHREDDVEVKLPEHVKVGEQLFLDGDINEPVVVRFVGPTRFNKKGIWIGIALSEATGKHGGIVDGHRYFTCKPKHGIFVRAERLYDDYFCPGDGSAPSRKTSKKPAKIVLRTDPVKPRYAASRPRRHPLLDKAEDSSKNRKNSTLRYYMDPKGRRMHTLKQVDPYGRQTLLLHEPVVPFTCNCANHTNNSNTNKNNNNNNTTPCATCQPAHTKMKTNTITNTSTNAKQTQPTPPPTQGDTHDVDDDDVETPSDLPEPIEVPERVETVESDDDDEEESEDNTRLTPSNTNTNGNINNNNYNDNGGNGNGNEATITTATPAVNPTTPPTPHKQLRPGASGLSDDEDDGDNEDDSDDDWLSGSKLHNQTMSTVKECTELAKRLRKAAIADKWDEVRNMLCDEAASLVVDEDILLKSGVGKIVGKLRQAPVISVGFAADSVIEGWKFQLKLEPTESTKAIQQKTEKLLHKMATYVSDTDNDNVNVNVDVNSPAPVKHHTGTDKHHTGTDSARRRLEESLEPVEIEIENSKRKKNALDNAAAAVAVDADDVDADDHNAITHRSNNNDNEGGNNDADVDDDDDDDDYHRHKPIVVASGILDDDDDDDDDDDFTANHDSEGGGNTTTTPTTTPKIESETFIALTVLDQCEAAMEDLKLLVVANEWDKLLVYLRLKVLPLLVTEEDLRRSGIGKIIAKIVKHAGQHIEVKHQAQEVLDLWKEKVHHRDPEMERKDQAERIEREKFLAYMSLEAATLYPRFKRVDGSDDEEEEEKTTPKTAMYYTKKYEITRGTKDKSLGFKMTLGTSKTGGLKATIQEVIEGGLAERCQTEGVVMEVDDEIIEINGNGVDHLTQAQLVALLKAPTVTLVLKSITPGTYETDKLEDYEDLYRATDNRLFTAVKQSDFITLA